VGSYLCIRDSHYLDTPCLVVDIDRLGRNIAGWQATAAAAGKRLRPHMKTHKTVEIARMQRDAGAAGITVAKVAEAELYADDGFDDVVIAFPVAGDAKWARIAALAGRARIAVNVENPTAARGLSDAAAAAGTTVGVWLDVDSGLGRCGVPIERTDDVIALGRLVRGLPGLRLEGLTTYRGLGFPGADAVDPPRAGRTEGELLVELAAALDVVEIAAGSTPTGRGVAEVGAVTEVRAGTYVFNDLMQLRWGSAAEPDLALSILATVVSTNRDGRLTVDAGSKTFSGDVVLSDEHGRVVARSIEGDIVLDGLTEEHGVGRGSRHVDVGDRLQLIPVHACTCVNLSDELYAVRGDRVEAVWKVAARGLRR
jgi:D-serine deaminase-like pyridoxal phosphate-dependent protein